MVDKIVRSLCCFSDNPGPWCVERAEQRIKRLENHGFTVQTQRLCTELFAPKWLENRIWDRTVLLSVGTVSYKRAMKMLPSYCKCPRISFNVDLTKEKIKNLHARLLFKLIKHAPENTFNFAYVFNNPFSSPFFPAANYQKEGFAIGLQPTDLAEGCKTLKQWLTRVREVWEEIEVLFKHDDQFLGIDSSVAPLFTGKSSLVNFIKRIDSFSHSSTTNVYLKISKFLKEHNPKPVGLCGLMFPCLEDFELAEEYEKGNFSIEKNLFLSLHSGLGIDTYPIGVDESPDRVVEILRLVQDLSNKYEKPLSARFVSDGKAKIGDRTNFQNQYLKDVVVREL